jgi:hypothetical protein
LLAGQLNVGFALQTLVGFILAVSLIYTSLEMEQDYKKTAMRETLSSVAELVATETLKTLDYSNVGTITTKNIRLPAMEETTGAYGVKYANESGMLVVEAKSLRWQDVIARQPLYLDASQVIVNERSSHPEKMCLSVGRNTTNYMINITC